MAKMSRVRLPEALHYAERHIAAGAEQIEKQRRVIERLERGATRLRAQPRGWCWQPWNGRTRAISPIANALSGCSRSRWGGDSATLIKAAPYFC
jgi:hypothetical protein